MKQMTVLCITILLGVVALAGEDPAGKWITKQYQFCRIDRSASNPLQIDLAPAAQKSLY